MYPRPSIAVASSSALREELVISGINNDVIAFVLWTRVPVLKFAPLAICASLILSISSRRVGTNLNAMDIMIATSCEGMPKTLSGLRSLSIPLTSSVGSVVIVRIDALNRRRVNCHIISAPL